MFIEGVMNYTGSKFKLLPQLIDHFDYSKNTFVDVFAGGGSVFINILDKFETIIINDIIPELIGIHRGLFEGNDIIDKTKLLCVDKNDKEGYLRLRKSFNDDKSPEKLWALILCSHNNYMRFNKKFQCNQTFGKRTWNAATDKKVNLLINYIRDYTDKVSFLSKNFIDIDIIDNTMYYLDPPYHGTEAGYNSYWSNQSEESLYHYIREIDNNKSSFMISGVMTHDNKESVLLRKLESDGYKVVDIRCDYNKVSGREIKDTREVIIKNYD